MKRELTIERLKELLHYDPETGVFTWILVRRGGRPGKEAGNIHKVHGYRSLMIDSKEHKCHRLAWFYMTGEWPKEHVDHINSDRSDNRWCNLREATHSQNMMNRGRLPQNRSGLKGVSFNKQSGKWRSEGECGGKRFYLGAFDCPAAAHLAYVVWADIHHGEFAKVA